MNELLAAALGNATVVAVIGFLVKSIVSHQLDKDTAKYEAELKARTEHQLDRYRAELEKERIRLQISYGGIFENQADAVLALYRLCVRYRNDAYFAMDAPDNQLTLVDTFRATHIALYECYEQNRILLSESVDRAVRQFVHDFYVKVPQHQRIQRQYERVQTDEAFDRLWQRQEALRKSIEEEMPALLEQLVAMMREMLGSEGARAAGLVDGT